MKNRRTVWVAMLLLVISISSCYVAGPNGAHEPLHHGLGHGGGRFFYK